VAADSDATVATAAAAAALTTIVILANFDICAVERVLAVAADAMPLLLNVILLLLLVLLPNPSLPELLVLSALLSAVLLVMNTLGLPLCC
jgi:hypothetical protein